jgi:hypothetical protein
MTKISDQTPAVLADLDAADLIPLVDVSEAGAKRNKALGLDVLASYVKANLPSGGGGGGDFTAEIAALDARVDAIEAGYATDAELTTQVNALDARLDTLESAGSPTDPTFTTVNLANADTTLSRLSAGVAAVEGSAIVTDARNNPSYFADRAQDTADDGTAGPLLGAAVTDALVSQTKANALATLSRIAQKAELVLFGVPYAAGPTFPTINAGEIVVAGTALDANVYSATLAPTTNLEQDANAFLTTDSAALAVYTPFAEAAELINKNQSATVTKALSSNTLQINVNEDGHKIITSVPTGDVSILAACWDNITDSHAPVQIGIPFGSAADRTVSVVTPVDGLISVGLTGADQTASRTAFFELDRFNGQPRIRYLGESAAVAAANVAFVGADSAGSGATGVTPPAHVANDMLVAIAVAPSGTSLPTLPAGWTDSGLAADGTAPSIRVAYKVAASASETCTGFTSATQVHCYVFRKAGGTPTFHGTVVNTLAAFADTSVSYPALNPATNSIFIGIGSARSSDTLTLAAGFTLTETTVSGGTATNTMVSGYTANATSWSAANGTKTGSIGRARAIVCAVS